MNKDELQKKIAEAASKPNDLLRRIKEKGWYPENYEKPVFTVGDLMDLGQALGEEQRSEEVKP